MDGHVKVGQGWIILCCHRKWRRVELGEEAERGVALAGTACVWFELERGGPIFVAAAVAQAPQDCNRQIRSTLEQLEPSRTVTRSPHVRQINNDPLVFPFNSRVRRIEE